MKTAKRSDLLPVIQKEVKKVGKQITDLVVKDDKSLVEASDRIRLIKDLQKKVEKEKELFTAPAKEIIGAAKAKYDPIIETLKGFEKVLKTSSQNFLLERLEEERKSEAKIAARVQSGNIKVETGIRKLEELPQNQEKVRTEKSMLHLQFRKDIEVVNEAIVPMQYFVLDMVKLRRDVLSGIQVDGVRIIEVPVTKSL